MRAGNVGNSLAKTATSFGTSHVFQHLGTNDLVNRADGERFQPKVCSKLALEKKLIHSLIFKVVIKYTSHEIYHLVFKGTVQEC